MATCLLITGTVGAGKTATAYAVGELLQRMRMPHAVIDLDELRRGWPAPSEDPFNSTLELANLRSVSKNYRRTGARRIVAAGVVEGPRAVESYTAAVGMPLVLCRLKVDLKRVHERLIARHPPGPVLEWHLNRSDQLEGILDSECVADATIDVVDDSVERVAQRVLSAVGWM